LNGKKLLEQTVEFLVKYHPPKVFTND